MEISLPKNCYEKNLYDLLILLGGGNGHDTVTIDFSNVHMYPPGATVLLLSKIRAWKEDDKNVSYVNHESCRGFQYLQRVDFFNNLGLNLEENFVRHPTDNRFLPLVKIGHDGRHDADKLADEIAGCIFPPVGDYTSETNGPADAIEYSVSEMIKNVSQHSSGTGFVGAQYYQATDLIRVAIGDTGIGILESFQQSGSPFYNQYMSDLDAINLAIKPKVSSKTHQMSMWGESENSGVGLTLIKRLAEILDGNFCIISGCGFYSSSGNSLSIPENKRYKGTLCAMTFKRSKITNFVNLLQQAKNDLGLLKQCCQLEGAFL
ncbi:ATP-binding protein [Desulfuromonas thiophila]|uniref:ATP-binding protein n=1 Tax=Desulfuromonas thiophila TaxID=57664 RepID=UPI0029F51D89|nr:ATP-binding protein [Desulfuromonas thiophila]